MRVENNRIIIEPLSPILRENWFKGYDASKDESAWENIVETEAEQADWEW